jgi:Asp-tRNA(Asn)/Glu-tRNA(Gln) amidotransferase A subunit family amidase
MTEYEDYDALGLAALVRKREVSPTELLDAAIARIEQRDPVLNAVVTPLFDAARAQAAAALPSGPFTGVPFLVKELVAAVAGTASSAASRLYRTAIAPADSEIVARFRRAGLVLAGKTNSPEFGISPTTESLLYGITRNPWRHDLAPGGSSGGSAAAVAAGYVPVAHATDGGGSIRIPASACGLFGLKPTRGRISAGPDVGEGLSGLAVQHVVSRTVRDSAAMLDAIAGPLTGDPYTAAPPERPWLEEVSAAPRRLRIGFARSAPTGVSLHPDCVAAVEAAAQLCESLGHHVEEASPRYDALALERDFVTVFSAHIMANMARATGGALADPGLVEPLTRALALRGHELGAAGFIAALHRLHRESRRIAAFFEDFDLWLTPTLAQRPLPIGHFEIESGDADRWIERLGAFVPFTYPFNVTGQPAASVPLHWSADGLPIGCQFATRYGDEALLFSLAAQLEGARPWFERRPPLGAASASGINPASARD